MVEVWLPYGDVEIPIPLPDPIDIKINPRRIIPKRKEGDVFRELNRVLSGFDRVRILDSPLLFSSEKKVIGGILDSLGIDYLFVDEDPNIVLNVVRDDPLIGLKNSIAIYNFEYKYGGDPAIISKGDPILCSLPDKLDEVLLIDMVVDGLSRLIDIYVWGEGSSVEELRNMYNNYWGMKTELSSLVIASVGGDPWDNEVEAIYSSILKLYKISDSDMILVLIGRGLIRDGDVPNIISSISGSGSVSYLSIVFSRLMELSSRGRHIYYFGGLPDILFKGLGVKPIRNINRFIRLLPSKVKRSVTIIEDIFHLSIQ